MLLYITRLMQLITIHFLYRCDVSDEKEVEILIEKVRRDVGFVSILVNNAGIMPCHRFFTYTPSEIRKLFGINVFAHIWVCYFAAVNRIFRNFYLHCCSLCIIKLFISHKRYTHFSQLL